jgi:hypothetical protein
MNSASWSSFQRLADSVTPSKYLPCVLSRCWWRYVLSYCVMDCARLSLPARSRTGRNVRGLYFLEKYCPVRFVSDGSTFPWTTHVHFLALPTWLLVLDAYLYVVWHFDSQKWNLLLTEKCKLIWWQRHFDIFNFCLMRKFREVRTQAVVNSYVY